MSLTPHHHHFTSLSITTMLPIQSTPHFSSTPISCTLLHHLHHLHPYHKSSGTSFIYLSLPLHYYHSTTTQLHSTPLHYLATIPLLSRHLHSFSHTSVALSPHAYLSSIIQYATPLQFTPSPLQCFIIIPSSQLLQNFIFHTPPSLLQHQDDVSLYSIPAFLSNEY